MRLLLLEDDIVIASELERVLRKNDYQVDVAPNGDIAIQHALQNPYAVIILDVMVPGPNGYEVCATIRRANIDTPIIMLTAKDDIQDRVTGLDKGADDYLVKPFAVPELLARLRALSRRDQAIKSETLTFADLTIDPRTHTTHRANQEIQLTKREFSLLEALTRNPGHVLTRDQILNRVWQNEEALPNTVNFHMSSLRKKIDSNFPTKLIHTVHGLGYVLKIEE